MSHVKVQLVKMLFGFHLPVMFELSVVSDGTFVRVDTYVAGTTSTPVVSTYFWIES